MKLQPDKTNGLTINAYGPSWIEVNGQRQSHSLIVSSLPGAQVVPWRPLSFAELQAPDFESLMINGAELIIFGSGKRLQFPPAGWLQKCMSRGIGLETMDTAAACRTYNILASEGRKVIAGLLIEA